MLYILYIRVVIPCYPNWLTLYLPCSSRALAYHTLTLYLPYTAALASRGPPAWWLPASASGGQQGKGMKENLPSTSSPR